MAFAIIRLSLLVAIIVITLTGIESAIHILTEPNQIDGMTVNRLRVRCKADGFKDTTKKIVNIHITRHGQEKPLATVDLQKKLTMGPMSNENMKAKGQISNKGSYLDLTINKPGYKDAGSYRCGMNVIEDGSKIIKEYVKAQVTFYGQKQQIKQLKADNSKWQQQIDNFKRLVKQQNETIYRQRKLIQYIYKQACLSKTAGWTYYKRDFTCLKPFGEGNQKTWLAWPSAKDVCNTFRGNLVQIQDKDKNTFVVDMLMEKDISFPWLGIINNGIGVENFTYEDGTPIGTYQPWNLIYLRQYAMCGLINTDSSDAQGQWFRHKCVESRPYVCSIPPSGLIY